MRNLQKVSRKTIEIWADIRTWGLPNTNRYIFTLLMTLRTTISSEARGRDVDSRKLLCIYTKKNLQRLFPQYEFNSYFSSIPRQHTNHCVNGETEHVFLHITPLHSRPKDVSDITRVATPLQ
jgi:hypothetical protein